MITLQKLTQELSALLQVDRFPHDVGMNGLQVEGRSNIKKIAIAVSANLYTIKQAIALECDALLVHHGLFWKKSALPSALVEIQYQRIKELIMHDMALIAYHLPLDAHQQLGHNWQAAKHLGWKELTSYAEIGVQGKFQAQPIQQLVDELQRLYEHAAAVVLGGKSSVSSAVIISGAAYSYLPQVAASGIDCLITGSFEEPVVAWAHEYGIHFIALGHHATERIGMKALETYLRDHYQLQTCFITEENLF